MITEELKDLVRRIAVLPILNPRSTNETMDLIGVLADSGAQGVEIVLRTSSAISTLQTAIKAFPSLTFVAGTILSKRQYDEVSSVGVHFAISPGLSLDLAEHATQGRIPLVPGVQTATEVMAARAAGLNLLKFYPAEPAGGTNVLTDFGNVFPDVAFMPSGKIELSVLPKYAALSNVASVGGTWMHSERGAFLDQAEIRRRMSLSLEAMSRRA